MQPYFFPYLGYFQLMSHVDKFVFYDDVAYMKGGWVNRNRILDGGQAAYMTVPVKGAPLGTPIDGMAVDATQGNFPRKLRARIAAAYHKAAFRDQGLELFDRALEAGPNLSAVTRASVQLTAEAIGVRPRVVESSRAYGNQELRGVERVLDICRRERAATYVNAPGGRALYAPDKFARAGLGLEFLSPSLSPYPQQASSFVPGLSVLDVVMNVGPEAAGELAHQGACGP